MKKISVIIPVYNGEKYISACLDCLRNQSMKDIEVIFINDGSTDNTLDALKANIDYKFIVLSQKNMGAGAARNNGITHANGEYISFLDIDDIYANDYTLETLYNTAKEHNADVCGGSLDYLDKNIPINEKYRFLESGFINANDYQYDFGFTRFLYKREFLLNNNIFFPEYRVYEDPVFMLRVLTKVVSFYAITDTVYLYSGAHQNGLDTKKTIDYLHGLSDNLKLSSQYNLGKLHKTLYERLESSASYYAEKNLEEADAGLYRALIDANGSISRELLKKEGIELPVDYVIPALKTIWNASHKYIKFRKKILILPLLIKRIGASFERKKKFL